MEPAIVELFGRFRLRFGEREVEFVRRRDRQIIQYLALQPGGTASRAQLQATFWPGARRTDAARRLRTACSTIRRAIAACVGTEYLDAYFHTAGDAVTLRPENTINALAAFDEHLESAREARERGDLPAARRHFEAALRLNDRPLLSGEAPAPWIADRAHVCDERAEDARASLRAIEP
jgi:DNA-binding SARP family transcriptional activator